MTSTSLDGRAPAGGAPSRSADQRVRRLLLAGVWTLPVYAALLALSTLTHQPDARTDFDGYAEYVTTTPFLISHLVASIVGAGLGTVGLVSAALLVAVPSGRPARALVGAALGVMGNVLATALFGVAAFAQPAIGRAYRAGVSEVVALEADVYGGPLIATAVVGLLAFMAGGVLLGGAVARTSRRLRLVGTAYGALLVAFVVAGFTLQVVQPVAAFALVLVTVALAHRLPQVLHDVHAGVPVR